MFDLWNFIYRFEDRVYCQLRSILRGIIQWTITINAGEIHGFKLKGGFQAFIKVIVAIKVLHCHKVRFYQILLHRQNHFFEFTVIKINKMLFDSLRENDI